VKTFTVILRKERGAFKVRARSLPKAIAAAALTASGRAYRVMQCGYGWDSGWTTGPCDSCGKAFGRLRDDLPEGVLDTLLDVKTCSRCLTQRLAAIK
jgi:hypothetical protein